MVYTILSSHNFFVPIASYRSSDEHRSSSFDSLVPCFNNNNNKISKKELFHTSVSSSSASIPYHPINLEYLRREFSGHGTTFEDIGETCIAKLELDNGSSATVMLPSGVITSYKVPVWHGGKVELLHTSVSQDEQDGSAVIQGGVSSAFCSEADNYESCWSSSSNWILKDITGNSEDNVQIELASDRSNMLEMKQIITLREETLSCELTVLNTNTSPIQIKGSILSHLTVSTPEATYAVGLQGSDFFETTPFLPRFGIILDEERGKTSSGFGGLLNPNVRLPGLVGKIRRENGEEIECEEEHSNYKQLNGEMCRIYTSAPRNFTVIDRGRRNSVVVGREGFEEVYVFSPGSRHESYSRFSFVCIGQSALLNPITLNPGAIWRGVQHLHNPNL